MLPHAVMQCYVVNSLSRDAGRHVLLPDGKTSLSHKKQVATDMGC